MSDHPPASHHLPLRECFPDVWLASSANAMSIPLGLKITFGRNMVAVRVPDGWVLLNPVRLSEGAEAELLAKAPLKHAVRLGTFHGRDDRYYVDRFGVEFWVCPESRRTPSRAFSRRSPRRDRSRSPARGSWSSRRPREPSASSACRSIGCS